MRANLNRRMLRSSVLHSLLVAVHWLRKAGGVVACYCTCAESVQEMTCFSQQVIDRSNFVLLSFTMSTSFQLAGRRVSFSVIKRK